MNIDDLGQRISDNHTEVVQRLTALETNQVTMKSAWDAHIKWGEAKSTEMEKKLADHESKISWVKGVGATLAFLVGLAEIAWHNLTVGHK